MTDPIERQAVIDFLLKWIAYDDDGCQILEVNPDIIFHGIEAIPSAEVEPVKRGKWINDKGLYRCSACNHLWSELWWTESCPINRMYKIMPYCPNCGARMEGEEA